MQCVGGVYEFGSDLIGHGAFAIVYKGRHKSTGQVVAIKQILLKNIPGKLSSMRQKEISILKDLKHSNIVQLFDCYETNVELYLVMEFCNGGDLADYLHVKKTLSEDSIKHLSRQIASALVFIHKHHIIHRDIKPQNVLLSFPIIGSSKQFKDASIKIADFGFARYLLEADMAATICGSPIYMAPEILIGHRYDSKADMWSTGVILYQCVTGTTPFRANDPHSLRKQYIRNTLIPRIPPGISSLLSDLLLKLIKKSPLDRMTQDEFQSHPFLHIHTSPEVLSVEDTPSLHTKSSPLPINRPTINTTQHGNRSPKTSPRSGHGSQKAFSSSSGPPSIHRIVTNSSLHKYYSSPPTNVTDEGFILVGTPGTGPQQTGSISSSSIESISSSSQHSSPHNFNLLYSPHNDTPPVMSTQSLSHTTPFLSLFKPNESGTVKSVSSQRPLTQATPTNYINSPGSSPHTIPLLSSSPASSPGQRTIRPSSRSGSNTKLSTLVESHCEETDHVTDHMIDSMNMITPSLLFESDILRNELERLSINTNPNDNNVLGLLTNMSIDDNNTNTRKATKGLNLSQELADIRKRDITLSHRRLSLFHIGDSIDEPDLSPDPGEKDKGMFSNHSNHSESPCGTEELFVLEEDIDSPLHYLQQHVLIAHELLRIAKTRQGPMVLLSSSMGDSGSMVDHVVRFSEQLVLCTKAATVVRDGVRQYNISNAVISCEPIDIDCTVVSEAEQLERLCLEKAKMAKDLYHKCLAKRRKHSLPQINVTAEKLIFFQATDMCKQSILEENTCRRNECLKKYRLANMLLKLLQSDAKSISDRNTIQKYITLIKCRQHQLLHNVL